MGAPTAPAIGLCALLSEGGYFSLNISHGWQAFFSEATIYWETTDSSFLK
jgi:hypothetical protein